MIEYTTIIIIICHLHFKSHRFYFVLRPLRNKYGGIMDLNEED